MTREAAKLLEHGMYQDSVLLCDEAIRLVPSYSWAHLVRGEQIYSLYGDLLGRTCNGGGKASIFQLRRVEYT